MRRSSVCIAIFLTLLFPRAFADVAVCPVPDSGSDFSWMDDLSRTLDDSLVDRGPRRARPIVEPDEPARVTEDLKEPWLARLRVSSRSAAAKCRFNTRTSQMICRTPYTKYKCYRGVKEALVDAGMVDAWWSEDAASDAHDRRSLEKRGFRNLLGAGYSSASAPLGAVLVYSGGLRRCRDARGRRQSCGHIEIKLNANEFCSDYCKSLPADAYIDRKLIGVYVKE